GGFYVGQAVAYDRRDQRLLIAEMIADRIGVGRAGGGADLAERSTVDAMFGEQYFRRLDDRDTSRFTAPAPPLLESDGHAIPPIGQTCRRSRMKCRDKPDRSSDTIRKRIWAE